MSPGGHPVVVAQAGRVQGQAVPDARHAASGSGAGTGARAGAAVDVAAAADGAIPVQVLTGFLGAGKTSWLNAQLRAGQVPASSVLLINDFGALQVDASLVAARDDQLLRLANGCICCSLSDNLASQLSQLAQRRPRPAALYIEGSGIAHPRRLHEAIRLNRAYTLSQTVCLVDAGAVDRLVADPETALLWHAQITAATQVRVNRVPASGVPAPLASLLARLLSGVAVTVEPATEEARTGLRQDTLTRRADPGSGTQGGNGPDEETDRKAAHATGRTGSTGSEGSTGSTASAGASSRTAAAGLPWLSCARCGPRSFQPVAGGWQSLSFSHPGDVDATALEALLHDFADVLMRAKGWLRVAGDARWQVFQYTVTSSRWLACSHRPQAGALSCIVRAGLRLPELVRRMQALGFVQVADAGLVVFSAN